MQMVDVLHMEGGIGENSYGNNSLIQGQVLSMTRALKEEAITKLYECNTTQTLCIADLGCASGPNTFMTVFHLINAVCNLCKKLDRQPPEFQVYLNDLPGNDFNAVFRSLKNFHESLKGEVGDVECFLSGIPGSFYGRLFTRESLHFVHSSYSLHWLSQVPKGLEDNKGNIYMSETSPQTVLNAYYEQFQRDFQTFLKCRSEEMVGGGFMVLTFKGRKSDNRSSKECTYQWNILSRVLNELVEEGKIEEEKLHTFNIPEYSPSLSEIENEVEKEGSFTITQSDISKVSWIDENKNKKYLLENDNVISNDYLNQHDHIVRCLRSVIEPLLVHHFGDCIMEEVFHRFKKKIYQVCEADESNAFFVNVTVSMVKGMPLNSKQCTSS